MKSDRKMAILRNMEALRYTVRCDNSVNEDTGLAVNYLNSSVCPSFAAPMLESAIVFRPKVDPKPLSP